LIHRSTIGARTPVSNFGKVDPAAPHRLKRRPALVAPCLSLWVGTGRKALHQAPAKGPTSGTVVETPISAPDARCNAHMPVRPARKTGKREQSGAFSEGGTETGPKDWRKPVPKRGTVPCPGRPPLRKRRDRETWMVKPRNGTARVNDIAHRQFGDCSSSIPGLLSNGKKSVTKDA
jgi:hypothetical protein